MAYSTRRRHNFVEQVPKDLMCFVCHDAVYGARTTECCGQHMCLFCSHETYSSSVCPHCGSSPLATQDSHIMRHQLQQLHVHCTNKNCYSRDCIMDYPSIPTTTATVSNDYMLPVKRPVIRGCDWTGAIDDLQHHLETQCPHTAVTCQYKCGTPIRRCQKTNHEKKECRKRPFTCWYCNMNATAEKIDCHASKCEKRLIECLNKCHAALVQKDMDQHLDHCPLQLVPCEFEYTGCKVKLLRKDYALHMEENVSNHTLLSHRFVNQLPILKKMEEQIADTRKEVEEQKESADKEVKEMNELIICLKTAVNNRVKKNEAHATEELKQLNHQMTDIQKQLNKMNQKILMLSQLQLEGITITVPCKTSASDPLYILGYCISVRISREDIAVKLVLQPGQYDNYLSWPIDGMITLLLLHYRDSRENKEMMYCINKIRQPRIPVMLTYTLGSISSLSHYTHGIANREYRLLVKNAIL